MISGSGPTDRDGNSTLGFVNDGLKMVAHGITEAGFAVLRYDKRGIAKSKAAIEDPASLRFDDFIVDAKSWVQFLRDKGYKKVIIAGHSQGSLVGIMAAQANEDVDGFISISGLSEDAGAAIVRQIGQQSKPLSEEVKIKLDSIKDGFEVKKYSPLLISILNPQIQPFLASYIKYDPSEEIKKLDIPVLIINGTTDLQVRTEDAQRLKESYPAATIKIINGMNHVLKDAPEGDLMANSATYNKPELPLSEGLMPGIVDFIKNL